MGVLEPTVFDLSREGREGVALPELDVPPKPLEELLPRDSLRRTPPGLPELSEPEVVRHFVHISSFNHHIDRGFYPLGSCTMKYNPKVNEMTARLAGFAHIHPQSPSEMVQGALRLMHELADLLCRISGLDEATLQPAAGAHGELAGLMMIRAYHEKQGRARSTVLIPDSSHGTNPASVTLAGYRAVQVASNEHGLVDIDDLRRVTDEEVAALMLTNPNTLGLFESDIEEIERIVHGVGAQLYMDGANLNALLGIVRPGDMGFDVVHFNLHKTFSTPHGGGGPGSGPVGVKSHIAPFLPVPVVVKGDGGYRLEYDRPDSIGKIQAFYGNFAVMVRAYTYIRMMGAEGLRAVSENAIINANYLKQRLAGTYALPYPQHCQHEFVLSGTRQKEQGVKTLDIAKRLLDFGVHAPTIYFPLIVPEALMIEPTETESKESLDHFVGAMLAIAEEVSRNPERVRTAPHTTPVGRLDEAGAGRRLDVRWRAGNAL